MNPSKALKRLSGTFCLLTAISMGAYTVSAAEKIKGNAKPKETITKKSVKELQDDFLELRLGMFICYNMATYEEDEWVEGYPDPSTFNPGAKVNTDAWADAAVSAGMKYGVLTVKHVSGFCLWDSEYTTYDVMHRDCPYKEDLVEQFIESFRSRGLKVGLYYCWRNPGFDDEYNGRYKVLPPECDPATHNLEEQIVFQKQQITELLERYPDVFYIFNDALDPRIMPADEAAAFFRSKHPNVLASANWWDWGKKGMPYLDLAVTETRHFPVDNNAPGETNWCLEDDWFWNTGFHTKKAKDIVPHINTANGRHANFLLNVGPDKEGNIIGSSVKALAEIGNLWKDSDQVSSVAPLSFKKQGEGFVLEWRPQPDNIVRMGPPEFVIKEGANPNALSMEMRLTSQKCVNDHTECEYLLMIKHAGIKRTGTYRRSWSVAK